MKRTRVHVIPFRKGWAVKFKGQVVYRWDRKVDAVKDGVLYAKDSEPSTLVIHGRDGAIQEERTYPRSTDPRRYRG